MLLLVLVMAVMVAVVVVRVIRLLLHALAAASQRLDRHAPYHCRLSVCLGVWGLGVGVDE